MPAFLRLIAPFSGYQAAETPSVAYQRCLITPNEHSQSHVVSRGALGSGGSHVYLAIQRLDVCTGHLHLTGFTKNTHDNINALIGWNVGPVNSQGVGRSA
jgi:hypothetical protein